MASFFQRLAKATPVAFANSFGSQPKSGYRIPFRALAAVSGGISYLYYVSSPDMVLFACCFIWVFLLFHCLRQWHHWDKMLKENQNMLCIHKYTPISNPDAKGYFDLLIKVYPEGKMSQHFASLKPGDVRLAKATAVAFANAFGSQPKSGYRIPFRALAAVSGGISYLDYVSSPDMMTILKLNTCLITGTLRIRLLGVLGLHWDKLLKGSLNILFVRMSLSSNAHAVYPEGKMSQHFASLKPGDVVEVKG
ncbi:hypothetical protein FEM48_Zijuj01G0199800 [Ziziphus jujuba var. spinosa]|uniref:cytochrome-b5 reductase n=1 Tax=Ziziphus jujuba var. spinosa TaxID=714518 RepID=A0A978W394_ZIZJJ|nr:hypothetical protein FEM48_Zijuj01G0199800 [Ziziphus jujuba var. spinosa]